MTLIRRTLFAKLAVLAALGLGLLAGCVTQPPGSMSRAQKESNLNRGSASGDLATSSDDSEARRRARIRLELASAYFAQGQLNTALDEVKQALVIDPRFSDAYDLRGLIYSALGEFAKAEDSFKRAIEMDARNGSALHNYAWMLCGSQQYPAADALFAQAANFPQSVVLSKTLLARGVCQIRSGLFAEAEKTLIRSYEMDPSSPATAFNLASVLFRRGEYERARFYVRRVNNVPEQITADSIWLGIRIENKLNNISGRDELSSILRSRFPNSKEAAALEAGRIDE